MPGIVNKHENIIKLLVFNIIFQRQTKRLNRLLVTDFRLRGDI